jgi:hypothetical protein
MRALLTTGALFFDPNLPVLIGDNVGDKWGKQASKKRILG